MYQIKFGTDGWRAIIAKDYTIENLARVTEATAKWLKTLAEKPSLMLGYDCRFNGKMFAETVANIMAHHGIRVFITPDFSSTPMISLATVLKQCTAGIIITASHNPPEYSGFKIKGSFGGPAYPAMITQVEQLIPDSAPNYPNIFEHWVETKQIEYYDAEALYINHLRQSFNLDLIKSAGFTLGYDAMYGAGQKVIKKLFPDAHLLHCEYNPSFLGQAPEPIAKNLKPFEALIKKEKLDIGLATDGDADRIGLYDEQGNFVDSHHILLLLIHYLHKYKGLSGKVVTSFSCTGKIKKMAEKYNLPSEVTKIGFKHICEIMLQEDVLVGGEESGGISVIGHVPERDGIYVGLIIYEFMAKTGKKLTELVREIYDVVGEFWVDRNDLHITEEIKQKIVSNCKSGKYNSFGNYKILSTDDLDGYKYHLSEDSWVMIRASGTEPVLRVYAEAKNAQEVNKILEATVQTILN